MFWSPRSGSAGTDPQEGDRSETNFSIGALEPGPGRGRGWGAGGLGGGCLGGEQEVLL